MRLKKIFAIAVVVCFSMLFTGCDDKGPAEKAGEKIDNAVEKAGDKMEDVGDAVKEKTEEMKEKAKDVTH